MSSTNASQRRFGASTPGVDSLRLFSNDLEATFVEGPNRFVVHAEAEGRRIRAHCPNPGRLTEILTPGRRLILEKRPTPGARTEYTLVGTYYRGAVVPLYSGRANAIAGKLLIPLLYPGHSSIQAEWRHGRSRFDFRLEMPAGEGSGPGTPTVVEVKAVTLVEFAVARFPDAVSLRGRRHLFELAHLAAAGFKAAVLFVVTHGSPAVFRPNVHADPQFAAALAEARERIAVHVAEVSCDSSGLVSVVRVDVPVDLTEVGVDRGVVVHIAPLGGGADDGRTGRYQLWVTALDPGTIVTPKSRGQTELHAIVGEGLDPQDVMDQFRGRADASRSDESAGDRLEFAGHPLHRQDILDLLLRLRNRRDDN